MIPQEIDGRTLVRCAKRPLLDAPSLFQEVFAVYSWYQRGYLPESGGYLDQAVAFVQLIEIFETAKADAKAVQEKIDAGKKQLKLM